MRKFILAATTLAALVVPAVAIPSAMAAGVPKGTTMHVCVSPKKHGIKARLAQKCRHSEHAITLHLAAPRTVTGPMGPNGPQGSAGANGTNGVNGAQGPKGDAGDTGPQGSQGPAGVGSPFTWTYGGTQTPDSGYCGNNWATDSFDSEFAVNPLGNGSYLVVKYLNGSFTTLPGTPEPNGEDCSLLQAGGVTGTFRGVETWTINSPGGGQAASFDPTAAPKLDNYTSGEAQNRDFTQAVFPGSTYSGEDNFDFVYHTGSNGSWVDSNTPANNTGNIVG